MDLGKTVGPFLERIGRTPEAVDFVEPALGPRNIPLEELDVPDLRGSLAEAGLSSTVHLPADNPLAVAAQEIAEGTVSYLTRSLSVAADFGAEKGVVHADADRVAAEDPRALEESVRRLGAAGEARGVTVVVENLGHLERGYDLFAVGDALARVDVPMCFDVGHALMEVGNDGIEEFLASYADLVGHVHVHDSRERGDSHLPLGAGDVKLGAAAEELLAAGFDGTVALEAFVEDPDLLKHSLVRTREAFRAD